MTDFQRGRRAAAGAAAQGDTQAQGNEGDPAGGTTTGGVTAQDRDGPPAPAATIRTMQPGDLDWVGQMHHELYVASGDYAPVFDDYVAKGIAPFRDRYDPARDRLWVGELGGRRLGAIAIQHSVERPGWAQLRWFFVLPAARGTGLGSRLLEAALAFCRDADYQGVYLWTMQGLDAARRLYERAGLQLVETAPAPWHDTLWQQAFERPF